MAPERGIGSVLMLAGLSVLFLNMLAESQPTDIAFFGLALVFVGGVLFLSARRTP
jgi:hypothetical protein